MLSQIQQTTSFKCANATPNDPALRLELRILNALATVIVINNEVVAVVENHENGEKGQQVIACTRLARDREELIVPQPQTLVGQFWKLFATSNPRRDEDELAPWRDVPTIVDAKPPSNLPSDGTDPQVEDFVDQYW